MGIASQNEIENFERSFSNPDKLKPMCRKHFKDYAIQDFIKQNGSNGKCYYCENSGLKIVANPEHLVGFLMKGIKHYFNDAANELYYESAEDGYQGETFDKYDLINYEVGLETDPFDIAESIADCIDDTSWCYNDPYGDTESETLGYAWNHFKEVIKHQARYLFFKSEHFKGNEYQIYVSDILEDISLRINKFNLYHHFKRGDIFFRCRQHPENENLIAAHQMTAPPNEFAILSNRMSPSGISLFYGAETEETAIKEVVNNSDKKNDFYTTCAFVLRHKLTLVDLTNLPMIPSIFDNDKRNVREAWIFLHDFARELSQPIKRNGHEHIDYIPSQVITEYLRFVHKDKTKVNIDGILYNSTKHKGKCCVLFYNHSQALKELDFLSSSLQRRKI
jgi:hypothetical protein